MKKMISMLLIISILFTFSGCSSTTKSNLLEGMATARVVGEEWMYTLCSKWKVTDFKSNGTNATYIIDNSIRFESGVLSNDLGLYVSIQIKKDELEIKRDVIKYLLFSDDISQNSIEVMKIYDECKEMTYSFREDNVNYKVTFYYDNEYMIINGKTIF